MCRSRMVGDPLGNSINLAEPKVLPLRKLWPIWRCLVSHWSGEGEVRQFYIARSKCHTKNEAYYSQVDFLTEVVVIVTLLLNLNRLHSPIPLRLRARIQ